MWTITKINLRSLSLNSVMILIYIIEVPVLLLIIFGMKINVENGIVNSLIFFNRNIDDVGILINFTFPYLLQFYILIHVFLYLMTTSGVSLNIIKSPISPIILTKKVTRNQYVIAQYLSYNLFIFIHILVFGTLIFLILYIKTQLLLFEEVFLPCLHIALLITSYTMIYSLLGVIIDSETFIFAFGFIIYFFLGYRIENITIEDGLFFNIIKYIFPPILSIKEYNSIITIDSLDLFKIGLNIFYIVIYLLITILIYSKKDLS